MSQYFGKMSPTTSPAVSLGKTLKILGAAIKEKNMIPPIHTTKERRCRNLMSTIYKAFDVYNELLY